MDSLQASMLAGSKEPSATADDAAPMSNLDGEELFFRYEFRFSKSLEKFIVRQKEQGDQISTISQDPQVLAHFDRHLNNVFKTKTTANSLRTTNTNFIQGLVHRSYIKATCHAQLLLWPTDGAYVAYTSIMSGSMNASFSWFSTNFNL